jgi:hypothetical protein
METLQCSLCHTRIDKLYVVFKPDHQLFYYHMYCYQKIEIGLSVFPGEK